MGSDPQCNGRHVVQATAPQAARKRKEAMSTNEMVEALLASGEAFEVVPTTVYIGHRYDKFETTLTPGNYRVIAVVRDHLAGAEREGSDENG